MVSVVGSIGTTLTSTDPTSSTSSNSSSNVPSAASAGQSLIQLSGLSSGIDTSSIITQLMAAAGVPRDQVYQQQEWVEWQQDAYRGINTALSTFQTAEQNLQFQSTFNPYMATSSDQTDVTATVGSNVMQGSYTLSNIKAATPATLISSNAVWNSNGTTAQSTDTIGATGTFQIQFNPTGGGTAQTATINVSSGGNFQAIARNITSQAQAAGMGLTATFDSTTSRFVFSSTNTGNLGSFTISETDGGNIADAIVKGGIKAVSSGSGVGNITEPSFLGQDASFNISAPGASSIPVTSHTNNISVLGLNLTINNSTSNTVNVNVGVDTDSVYNTISNFVNAYNTLLDTINTQLNSKRDYDYPPLTQSQKSAMSDSQISLWEAKAKSGVLENDPTLQNIVDQLQSAVNNPVQGIDSGQLNSLASIGVGTEFVTSSGTLISDPNNTGHLQIDEKTLRAVIANNPTQVMNLFTTSDSSTSSNDSEGIGQRLYNVTNNGITQLVKQAGTPDGAYNDGSYLGSQVSDLSQQLSNWADRLSQLQTMYTNEFAQMETAMSQFNSQGSYLQLLG